MPAISMMLSGATAGGSSYTGPLTVTYSHTDYGGSTDLTDFALFVWATDARLKSVANGGQVIDPDHIRLSTDAPGTSLGNWKVIHYDDSTGLWVAVWKCSSFSHTTDTVRYLNWDDNGVSTFQGGTASNIWDSSYKSVHLFGDGTTLVLTDETSNADNETNVTLVVALAGPNGLGGASAPVTHHLDGANTINIAQPTFEYFCNIPSTNGRIGGIVDFTSISTADKTTYVDGGTPKINFYCFDTGAKTLTGATTFTFNTWHYIATLADGTNMKIFLNGTQDATQACGNTFAGYTHAGFRLAGTDNGGPSPASTAVKYAFAALSNVARSADFILARSKNFLSATFFTVA